MITKRSKLVLPLLAGALALGACENLSDPVSGSSGGVSILLTDAPGDLQEAWVEVTEIYLQGESDDDAGRVYLKQESTGLIDLLTLSGGRTAELVEDAVVPAGTYAQLRFVIGDAYVKTEDGRVFATQGAALPAGVAADGRLQIPSGAQTGFKVNLPGGAVSIDDDAVVLVVDFDVSQSFGQQAGQSGMWVMRPVMNATDFEASGTIAGMVALGDSVALPDSCGGQSIDLSGFVPTADAAGVTKSGVTDANGAYKISFVSPDTYTLSADPIAFENGDTLTFTAAATPASVEVVSGQTSTANYQITEATCKVTESEPSA